MEQLHIKTAVSFDDMHEIIKVLIRKNSFGMIRIFYFVLFALGYSSIFRGTAHPIEGINILVYILFIVLFFFAVVLIDRIFSKETVKKVMENDRNIQRSTEKVISKEGIITFSKDSEWLFKWSDLHQVLESENMYMLMFKEASIYINKSAFKSYDEQHFFMSCLEKSKKPKVEETEDYIMMDDDK